MKNILMGITFWTIVIGFILLMTTIAQTLANLITMKTIVTVAYIALGLGLIYLMKN